MNAIDDYIARFPPEVRKILEELRTLIRGTASDVTERISYGMPTFDLNGRRLVYVAGWKKHIALYPITAGVVKALEEEIAPYRSGKGTLRFPLGEPMPIDLIRRIVECRVQEVAGEERRDISSRTI